MEIEKSEQKFNWQALKEIAPAEMMKIKWLKEEVKKNSLEELIPFNPAIESIINLIEGAKELSSDQETEDTINDFEYILEKEKMFALINRHKKIAKTS